MNKLSNTNYTPQGGIVFNQNGKALTTSRKVAESFNKQHFHVVRDIRNLETDDDFNASNFGLVEYIDSKGEKRPEYVMTRDGFTILAMGFTGKKAMKFKVDYIKAFNQMEEQLRAPVFKIKDDNHLVTLLMEATLAVQEKIELKEKNNQLLIDQEAAKPKLDYYESVLNNPNKISAGSIAAGLGISTQKLNKILHENGIQFKLKSGQWVLYSKYRNQGLTVESTHDVGTFTTHHTYWTEKGKEFIHRLLTEKR